MIIAFVENKRFVLRELSQYTNSGPAVHHSSDENCVNRKRALGWAGVGGGEAVILAESIHVGGLRQSFANQ